MWPIGWPELKVEWGRFTGLQVYPAAQYLELDVMTTMDTDDHVPMFWPGIVLSDIGLLVVVDEVRSVTDTQALVSLQFVSRSSEFLPE